MPSGNVDGSPGGLHLDGRRRHDGADDHLRLGPGSDDQPPRRELQLLLRAGRDLRVLARRRAVRRRAPRRWSSATSTLGEPRVPRPRDRPEGQRRDAGRELRLDDRARHDGAGDDAPRAAAGDDDRHLGDVQLLLERARRGVRVRDRRRAVRGLRAADGLHRPAVGRAHLPGARDRPGRPAERRPDARDLHLDHRRAARHDAARDEDPDRPAREDGESSTRPSSSSAEAAPPSSARSTTSRSPSASRRRVHRPRARRARLPAVRRPTWPATWTRRRPAYKWTIVGAAGDDDRARAGRDERERDRAASPSPPTRPASSSSARSTASRRRSAPRRRPTRA